MTNQGKFELVASIEDKLGIATSNLWKADKATLEAINKGLGKSNAGIFDPHSVATFPCDKCGVNPRFPSMTWCVECVLRS